MEYVLIALGVIALAVIAYFLVKWLYKEVTKVRHLDLYGRGLTQSPAVPYSIKDAIATLLKLGIRAKQSEMAKNGLNNIYQIKGETANGYSFLYDDNHQDAEADKRDKLQAKLENAKEKDLMDNQKLNDHFTKHAHPSLLKSNKTLTHLSLDHPEQFSISWTNFYSVYHNAQEQLPLWTSTLVDSEVATQQFWPLIAQSGSAYNLIILKKIDSNGIEDIKNTFESVWEDRWEEAFQNGKLYEIDLRIFSQFEAQTVDGFPRFTPSTRTLLVQANDKTIKPVAIRVADYQEQNTQMYSQSKAKPFAWLYALQAAKTSVTVYGIWIGHVYHWHIVTAAMQMTMFNTMKKDHVIRQFMDPQSNYLIGFDTVLLLLWGSISPPTSFSKPEQYLELNNAFAKDRNFFDDDPLNTLAKLGLKKEDFSVDEDWDQYPVVQNMLYFWKISGEYVSVFVDQSFADDQAVIDDEELQNWMRESAETGEGNIRGLPAMGSREALQKVLHSLIYRITVHGISRQNSAANPALTFTANFPPCLQLTDFPDPQDQRRPDELLTYLPNTGTIGSMMTFYFTFLFSPPYEPLLPLEGNNLKLYWPEGDPRNAALIKFRDDVGDFIKKFDKDAPLLHQWPASIET